MSSLLQHDGESRGNKVVLKMQLVDRVGHQDVDRETYVCAKCGKKHSVIYRVARRPLGMWGCWVQFRYNGEVHVPDLSVPISIDRLPRDAEKMDETTATAYWHS